MNVQKQYYVTTKKEALALALGEVNQIQEVIVKFTHGRHYLGEGSFRHIMGVWVFTAASLMWEHMELINPILKEGAELTPFSLINLLEGEGFKDVTDYGNLLTDYGQDLTN